MAKAVGHKRLFPVVDFHPGLSCLFSPCEIIFILHMIDIKVNESYGRHTNRSKSDYMAIMNLSEYIFDKCVRKMVSMNLMTRTLNRKGNRVYYTWNDRLYRRLLDILSATRDPHALTKFCNSEFKAKGRSIESIRNNEIGSLAQSTM